MRIPLSIALFAIVAAIAACGDDSGGSAGPLETRTVIPGIATDSATAGEASLSVSLVKIASGFQRPTYVTNADDGSGRLFVVEKQGIVRVVSNGAVSAAPFVTVTPLVDSAANERGLLGMAFHPKFKENGRFFLAFTAKDGANTVAEFRAAPGAATASPTPVKTLFSIPDTRSNHNGGMIVFGPDGYLYYGTGDGGGSGDPDKNGQKGSALLGKLLRVDVDSGDPYAVPKDNPFVGRADFRGEIWALGLRNPWRFSFDRKTGDLWIADVGQNQREEVDFQPAASKGGENYGWNVLEGTACFQPSSGCSNEGKVAPIHETTHSDGNCSITGGYVYRGANARLAGRYFFTDYCEETLWSIRRSADGTARVEAVGQTNGAVSSFGEAEDGEVYVVGDSDGTLYRLTAP